MPIAIPAGPRNVVGPTGHQSPWWVGVPTPGRVSGSGHIPAGFDRALKHIEEAARHCTHAKTPPGGVNRTSTHLYRVRTRSRLRVSFPLVAGSRGSTARRFRRVSFSASAGPRRHVLPPVTGVPARTRSAHMYRYRWVDRSGSLALDR